MPAHCSRWIARRVAAQHNTSTGGAHLLKISNLEVPRLTRVCHLFRPPVRELTLEALDLACRNGFVQQGIIEPGRPTRFHCTTGDSQVWRDEDTWMLSQQLQEFIVDFCIAH